jgi:hypothetical protein
MVKSGYNFSSWNTNSNGAGTTYLAGALYSAGTNLTLYAQWVPAVTFTDGSSFSQSFDRGSVNQEIGSFSLNSAGGILTSVVIKLNGQRSGAANFKLWEGDIESKSLNSQLGSTVSADPGDSNTVAFSGFSSALTSPSKYYFVTCDLASNATGYILPVIVNNSAMTYSGASLQSTIANAPLSGNNSPLPVKLNSFTAKINSNSVLLKWQTESEINNSGFDVERKNANGNWMKAGFVLGSGTTNAPANYSFDDKNLTPGKYKYRLKQIDNNGNYEYHNLASEVLIEAPVKFEMSQNYPNPFNPVTRIMIDVPKTSPVKIVVYDATGKLITHLANKVMDAGRYEVNWNGAAFSSGVYFYKIEADNFTKVMKMLLLK